MYKRLAAAPDNARHRRADRGDRRPLRPAAAAGDEPAARRTTQTGGTRDSESADSISGAQGGYALFEEQNQVDPRAVIRLVQHPDRDYRLEGPLKLRISVETEDDAERFEFAEKFLSDCVNGQWRREVRRRKPRTETPLANRYTFAP